MTDDGRRTRARTASRRRFAGARFVEGATGDRGLYSPTHDPQARRLRRFVVAPLRGLALASPLSEALIQVRVISIYRCPLGLGDQAATRCLG